MAVLIENMDIPESCTDCHFRLFNQLSPDCSSAFCLVSSEVIPEEGKERPDWCPLRPADKESRLAEYESTGLSPERIVRLRELEKMLDFFEADIVNGLDKLVEFEKAQSEGRLLRMPCKVGDMMYLAAYGDNGEIPCYRVGVVGADPHGLFVVLDNGERESISVEDIGRKYFLTMEEAIAVLERDGAQLEFDAGLNDKEGICPVCGGQVDYDSACIVDDDGGIYPWTCKSCDATGKEGFDRQFDRHYFVRDAQGNVIPGRPE